MLERCFFDERRRSSSESVSESVETESCRCRRDLDDLCLREDDFLPGAGESSLRVLESDGGR